MQLRGRVRYSEFETLGMTCPLEELRKRGDLNEDMLIVEYGADPSWSLFVGWWPLRDDHPMFGDPNGHFFITASRSSDKFHYTSIRWEARSLEELWSALQLIDGWLGSRS